MYIQDTNNNDSGIVSPGKGETERQKSPGDQVNHNTLQKRSL